MDRENLPPAVSKHPPSAAAYRRRAGGLLSLGLGLRGGSGGPERSCSCNQAETATLRYIKRRLRVRKGGPQPSRRQVRNVRVVSPSSLASSVWFRYSLSSGQRAVSI